MNQRLASSYIKKGGLCKAYNHNNEINFWPVQGRRLITELDVGVWI